MPKYEYFCTECGITAELEVGKCTQLVVSKECSCRENEEWKYSLYQRAPKAKSKNGYNPFLVGYKPDKSSSERGEFPKPPKGGSGESTLKSVNRKKVK